MHTRTKEWTVAQMIVRAARGIALGVGIGSSVFVSAVRASDSDSPRGVVQATADAVVNVLDDKTLSADQKRAKIEAIVTSNFDFTTLVRLTLARHWKGLTPAQQTQFVEEFRKHMSVTYGKRVEEYNNEKAVITGDRRESGDDWTVKTKIVRPNAASILVDYRLRKQKDKWMVIDVIIEGVSLVANFRSQFQEIISQSGAARLIDLLHEKNLRGETLKGDGGPAA